jgi:hypothetical protein
MPSDDSTQPTQRPSKRLWVILAAPAVFLAVFLLAGGYRWLTGWVVGGAP